ncbi:MAG TPA: hypothetical protein VI389_03545 [Geobacteraceae bacterium]
MKKVILTLAVAMLFASQAYAATTVTITNVKGFNQTLKVNISAQKNTDFNAWAACTAHQAGDKQYATTSAYGGLSYLVVTPGTSNCTAAPTAPTTPTDSTIPSGYTSM